MKKTPRAHNYPYLFISYRDGTVIIDTATDDDIPARSSFQARAARAES